MAGCRWVGISRWLATLGLAVIGAWVSGQARASERVVAIGGDITEIIYALGAEGRLVGTDTTSHYPAEAQKLPKVGYLRALGAEGILSLAPSLVIVSGDAGPQATLDQIRLAGVKLVAVPSEESPDGVVAKIRSVAHALGLPDDGQGLAARVAAGFARVKGAPPPGKTAQKVLFILSVGRGAPLAGGAGSSADRMIRLAGGVNAIDGFSGYKPLSVEMAIQAAPTAILVIDRTLDLMGGMEALRRSPLVANTPAGRNGNLIVMDGMYLLGFGPRTPEAARDLAVNLYGENGASGAGTGAGEAAVAPAR